MSIHHVSGVLDTRQLAVDGRIHEQQTDRSEAIMGRLFDLVEEHRDSLAPYQPSYTKIAKEVGVSKQTLLNWRAPHKLIEKRHLVALARAIEVDYRAVLDGLLYDIGYLYPEQEAMPSRRRRGVTVSDEDPDES